MNDLNMNEISVENIYFKSTVEMVDEVVSEDVHMNACNYNCQCDCGRSRDCCNNCYVKCSSINL